MITCCDQPMRERPTITHGMCWVCAKCGKWQDEVTYRITFGNGSSLEFDEPIRWDSPAPPEAIHHRNPSPN